MATINVEDVLAKTRASGIENFLDILSNHVINGDDPLLGHRVLDALGVLEIMPFLDSQYGVIPRDDEITEENFGTLGAIARFVVQKTAVRSRVDLMESAA